MAVVGARNVLAVGQGLREVEGGQTTLRWCSNWQWWALPREQLDPIKHAHSEGSSNGTTGLSPLLAVVVGCHISSRRRIPSQRSIGSRQGCNQKGWAW